MEASRQDCSAKFPSLIERMPYLRRLDALRSKARDLRNEQLRVLTSKAGLAGGKTASPATCVLFRRAKQLAWHLGLQDTCGPDEEPAYFLRWPRTSLQNRKGRVNLLSSDRGGAKVFFATQFLRARLGNLDQGFLTDDCVRCYYRIVCELYTMSSTNLAMGIALADGSDAPSTGGSDNRTFVTAECARAMNQFVAGLRTISSTTN